VILPYLSVQIVNFWETGLAKRLDYPVKPALNLPDAWVQAVSILKLGLKI
jgi:hypothetical protein